jgi:hypothetical protein
MQDDQENFYDRVFSLDKAGKPVHWVDYYNVDNRQIKEVPIAPA